MKRNLLVWMLIVSLGLAQSQAEPLSDFAQFRSYPYLDRGYRQARQANWPVVERLMRHLLERVPDNGEARELLVQALLHQQRFAEAEQELARLDTSGASLQEVRLAWIAQDPQVEDRLERWLATTSGDERERLWIAYSQALGERQGAAAVLNWLLGLAPRGDETALRQWRATLAEAQGRPALVIEQLAPLRDERRLAADDWQRLALAYIQREQWPALERLLASPPDPEVANAMRAAASARAIAVGDAEQAKRWLLRLNASTPLDDTQQRQLLQLAMQTGDVALVDELSRETGMGCLALAQWYAEQAPERGREWLGECRPGEDPQAWLVLAQRLDAQALLQRTRLPPGWEEARLTQLILLWERQGDTQQAIEWLARQPQTSFVTRQRARLLQAAGRTGEAASLWERHYRQSGDPAALDQAAFLYLESGDEARALALLETSFDRHGRRLPKESLERLASLYSQAEVALSPPRAGRLLDVLEGEARDLLLVRLASDGDCGIVRQHVGESPGTAGAWRALGTCAMPDRPGTAVVYYRHAVEQGDSASRTSLAYALQAAGDPGAAYRIWQSWPVEELDGAARLAAARSALATRHIDMAERYWAAGPHEDADAWQLGANIALARDRPDDALSRQRQALQREPSAERFYTAAGTAQATGEAALSLEWLGRAVRLAPDNPRYRADYAFRLAGSDDRERRREAMVLLAQSVRDYPEDFRLAEALALRYAEFGDNAASRQQLRRAIDLEQAPLVVEDESTTQLAQRRYRQRRMHETLSRRDSFTLTSTWSPAGIGTASTPASGGDQNTQIAQWDHALGDEPIDNGRQLALYARAVLDSSRRSRYGQALGAGIGLRAKPFSTLNLNLYGEVYAESGGHEGVTLGELADPFGGDSWHAGEASEDIDLLLRASASFLDQGDYRNDWRVDAERWSERQLYLDAAWWLRRGNRQGIARYRHGHAFKLPTQGPQTLMPYAMLQFTTQDSEGWQQDTRAGLGLRFQHWFDADRYNAYRGSVSVRMEYQQALGGELYARDNGWLTGIEVRF